MQGMFTDHLSAKRENQMKPTERKFPPNEPSCLFLSIVTILVQAISTAHLNHFNNLLTGLLAFTLAFPSVISSPILTTSHCSLRTSDLFKILQFMFLATSAVKNDSLINRSFY